MRYRNAERSNAKKEAEKAEIDQQADMFVEADTWEEFCLKRASAGIRFPSIRFLDPWFWVLLRRDRREWAFWTVRGIWLALTALVGIVGSIVLAVVFSPPLMLCGFVVLGIGMRVDDLVLGKVSDRYLKVKWREEANL